MLSSNVMANVWANSTTSAPSRQPSRSTQGLDVLYRQEPWHQFLPIFVVSTAALVFIILVIVIIICCCLLKKAKKLDSPSSPFHKITIQPAPKLNVHSAMLVQPSVPLNTLYTDQSISQQTRTKLKSPYKAGLLERRGSSHSLTINLSPKRCPSPEYQARESPTAEYLQTATRVLTSSDLTCCLDNVGLLYEEFWEIPMNHPQKVQVAGSGPKNRYRTIIPNEHSRVSIPSTDEDPISQYINANYIRGYNFEEKIYIASQGPMPHTIEDFWTMCWSERISIIVMITKLCEQDKQKCANYIPLEDNVIQHAGLDISVLTTELKDGYTIRTLQVEYLNEVRHLRHFWYTAWPDHRAPNCPGQLFTLVQDVENLRQGQGHTGQLQGQGHTGQPPVLVHCSAGIGRTGCFIAATIGMKQLQESGFVDVLRIVCRMREDRGGMVQTNEQYVFVYKVLKLFWEQIQSAKHN